MDAVQAFVLHHVGNTDHLRLPFVGVPLPGWVSLHGCVLTLAGVALVIVFGRLYDRRAAVPTGLTNALEAMVMFVRDQIAVPYLGDRDGRYFTPYFCTLFFFILAMNLLGLIPGLGAATANLGVTLTLAAATFGIMVIWAACRHGPVAFFKNLVPTGTPWWLAWFLFLVELVSLFIKAGALTIRLFANELAGHMVVFFLLGLVVVFGAWALPAVVMAVLVYVLELFVAFFQAYIFTLLSAVFIGQTLHPSH